MKRVLILAVAAAAACAPQPKAPAVDPYALTRDDSCYTVDLFTKVSIEQPGRDVPEAWRAFSGRWGGGKWAGEWCHDLYVLAIEPTGEVRVVETYAPYEPWGKRATAYRRTARIDGDGRLRLNYGKVRLEYWVQDGKLYGQREEGMGPQRIAMVRRQHN